MPKSSYKLGRFREYNLLKKLWGEGYVAFRMTGSAGGAIGAKIKPVDIVAIKKGKAYLIQASKERRKISDEEIRELKRIANLCQAIPMIAYLERRKWNFEIV